MLEPAILALALLAQIPDRALAQGAPADEFTTLTDEVRGEVRIAGTDRPAARVTLSFFDDKDGVVADEAGHFRWPIPAGSNVTAGPGENQGPQCRAFAHDARDWTWEVVGANPGADDFARRQARESLSEQARTRWIRRDGKPWLIVECPAFAMVEVALLGPAGKPVADRPVRVFPGQGRNDFPAGFAVRFAGRTDAQGRFGMRWFEGKRRLRVLVPGVGFGSTGMFEVVGGRASTPAMPRLAAFASAKGTLDPALAGPGTTVHAGRGLGEPGAWDRSEASCDDSGRFELADLIPGSHAISLTRADGQVEVEPGSLNLAPGQAVSGLVIRPRPPRPGGPAAELPPASRQDPPRDPKQEFVWVEGTIRDQSGRPVPGAVVYARTAYHGGIRMYEDVRKTAADATGRYQIQGPVWDFMDSVVVIACSGDRPPSVAYAPAPSADPAAGRTAVDIALAARGGRLRVAVIRDGKPAPGAWVSLQSDGVARLSQWARENPIGGAEVDPRFQPRARAGPDGVARFADVFPGTYRIIANEGPEALSPRALRWPGMEQAPHGGVEDLGVALGPEGEAVVAIHPPPAPVGFRVLRPGGAPVTDQNVSSGFGLGSVGMMTSLKLDGRGVAAYTFASPGLWAVDVRFLDTPLRSSPVTEEPYYRAEALLPISPGLAIDRPFVLQGVRHDRGSLRVRLLDAGGKPARGTAMILNGAGSDPTGVQFAGTTDASGEVRFADLPGGDYELRGLLDGAKPPFDPGPSGPYPEDDEALKGGMAMAEVTAGVEAGSEAIVDLRAGPVGYVRGTIHPSPGFKAEDYMLSFDNDRPWYPTSWRLDHETGRFTHGPLAAGKRTIKVRRRSEAVPWPVVGTYEVEVSGGVARLDIRPVEAPAAASPSVSGRSGRAMLGMGGVSEQGTAPRGPGGTVRMADGTTPAFGARALLFVPGQDEPASSGVADAAGNLTWRGRWTSAGGPIGPGEAAPKPTAVVWLPGLCGAAVVEFEPDRPIRAILPAPLAGSGRVTLGGRPVDGRDARVRIVAAHQGRGVLDAALGLSASARPDGRFDLRGLTPGRYRVQAARDGIWLSRSIELNVDGAAPVPDLALDIPEPGASIVVEVVDRRGRPVAGRKVTLGRPEGPLASLWPTAFRTDSGGKLTLRGLEAGGQSLRIEGEPGPSPFQVPEARPGVPRAEVVRIVSGKPE